jgi:hypothetical protein
MLGDWGVDSTLPLQEEDASLRSGLGVVCFLSGLIAVDIVSQ